MAKRDKRKMTKPVVLTGKEYFEKMYRHLPEFLLVKHRRGGPVVLTLCSESKAKELFEVLKYKFERNDFHSVLLKESADALRGSSMNLAEMNKRIFGFMDPDDVPCSKEAWEAATPKMVNPPLGMPMIFGTSGSINKPHWAHDIWEGRNKEDLDKFFIPVSHEESGPFPYLKDTGGAATVFDQNGNKHWSDPTYEVVPEIKGMVDQMNESIRLGNYMPLQELLRRLCVIE